MDYNLGALPRLIYEMGAQWIILEGGRFRSSSLIPIHIQYTYSQNKLFKHNIF